MSYSPHRLSAHMSVTLNSVIDIVCTKPVGTICRLATVNIEKCKFRSFFTETWESTMNHFYEIDTVDHFPEKIRFVSSTVWPKCPISCFFKIFSVFIGLSDLNDFLMAFYCNRLVVHKKLAQIHIKLLPNFLSHGCNRHIIHING